MWRPGMVLALVLLTAALPALAAELVVNGGFENNGGSGSSSFVGWNVYLQPGSGGSFYAQTGTTTPKSNTIVPPPPAGNYVAMADEYQQYTSSILYQDITLPANAPATLTMQVYVNNHASSFYTPVPASLDDFHTSLTHNQQARVDIMDPNAAVDDMGSGILLNVFQTKVGDPLESGYTTISADLSAFAGRTIRLRIAQVDNVNTLNFGVDSVSIESGPPAVPALSRWNEAVLAGLLLLGAAYTFRRRVHAVTHDA